MILLKLRRKALLLIALTSIVIIIGLQIISQTILLNSFATLEQEDTKQNVQRVLSAISSDLSSLETNSHDWGAWDDTYTFIQDKNEEYIELNLSSDTILNLKLNFMLFINSSGELIFARGFNLETEEIVNIPESIMEHLSPDSKLLQHPDADSSTSGIIILEENPILFASHPILPSSNQGEILGTLIMGYYLDSNRINDLIETTRLSVEIQQIDNPQMPTDFKQVMLQLENQNETVVFPLDSKSVGGYTIIKDVYREPALILRVDLPRSIYAQAQDTVSYFVVLLLATSIAFTAVIMLLLEKTVLSRLAQLNTSINKIRSQGDHSKRVAVKGKNDELTDLAGEINGMLSTLEQSRNKLQITNEKLSVVGEFTRHDVRNKLASILNNVYLIKKKMKTNDTQTLEHLKRIEVASDQVAQIFEFAKMYEKLGVEELEYIDVENFVKEVTSLHGLCGIKIVNDCKGLTVLADSLLRQLLYNLVDDTIKHSEYATEIRIYYQLETNQLKLVYEDNGIGIPEPEKEKIFQEGYGKGTGYGLYLIQKICDTYGWTIKETGKPSEGARFVITIPKINKNNKANYYTEKDEKIIKSAS